MARGAVGVIKYDTFLHIRFNSEEKEELKRMAAEQKVTHGELVRLFVKVGMRKLKEKQAG